MNIIPFVITIILILGMFSLSQFRQIRSPESEVYVAYFKTLRKTRNALAGEVYQKHRKTDKKKTESNSSQNKETNVLYFRDRYLGCKEGRLNLSSLLKKEKEFPLLKNIAKAYLCVLYAHLPDYDDALLDNMIKKQKEYLAIHKEAAPLYKLSFKDLAQQDLYYRLIRGTNSYNLNTKEGIPPMEDFFTFEENKKKPMQFNFASEVFLSVLFTPEFVAEVHKEEYAVQNETKRRKSNFDMEKLLTKANEKMIPDAHLRIELLDFSPANAKKIITQTDEKTQITVRAQLLSENSK